MYKCGERLVVSASDLVGYMCCGHLSVLSLEAAEGGRPKPSRDDPELEVLARRGLEHESAYLEHLATEHQDVVRIEVQGGNAPSEGDLIALEAATLEALRSGAGAVYQATFFDRSCSGPAWRGHADFLTRVERPSDLGPYSYEPEDTKLARHVRPSAILQLCSYAEQLGRLQGVEPEWVHVVLGGRQRQSFRLADFAAYYRSAKERFRGALSSPGPSYPVPVEHCTICAWRQVCEARWEVDDHLCRVAGLSRSQARRLGDGAGITTMTALASSENIQVPRMSQDAVARLVRQARLQIESRAAGCGPPHWELLPPGGPGRGLARLPAPDPGDVFFDIEGDPFVGEGGLEYLLGVGWMEGGRFVYRGFWAHDPAEEKASFEALIDFIGDRRRQHPRMHVYHYAPYEPAALGRLMGRHATREEELDDLLRGEVLVDLHRVVRQSVAVGTSSYSLKKLEALYMGPRGGDIVDAASSIVEYERWLDTGDDRILDAIGVYNRDDCESTRLLRDWLESRRADLEATTHEEVPRPVPPESLPADELAAELGEVAALAADLIAAGEPIGGQTARAHWLLAQMLDWHRREDKPAWWTYFRRVRDDTEEDLYRDTEAVAGLSYDGVERKEKRSLVHRYRFDPDQEQKLSPRQGVVDPASAREQMLTGAKIPGPGELVDVDPVRGLLWLKRGAGSAAPHPRALIPAGPRDTKALREALRRVGRSVLEHGIDGDGPYGAVRDLLLGRPPRLRGPGRGQRLTDGDEDGADAAVRLALALDQGFLPIQGPPGSGKTYSAAALVVALVNEGCRVGVTASSHAAIGQLLRAVMERSRESGSRLRVLQKAEPDQACDDPDVRCTGQNEDVERALAEGEVDVVAGTPWLFARPALDGRLDVLVVDEAGQLSLANTVAVGTAAQSVVLVGDPRQLAQPSMGTHPPGVGVSAMDQVLDGAATVSSDRGLFLDVTRRLSPDICSFVSEIAYDGRLRPAPGCELQSVGDGPSVGGGPVLAGSGIRWVPVDHTGNRTSCEEEADALAVCYRSLLDRPWTDQAGKLGRVGAEDILVVAPYNAQVALLATRLPEGARVGTVDRFQGQEAAVVLISLTASSAEEVPRGMEFLYSRNRLNVAVSRARALAVVAGSPRLLAVHCRSVEQLRLANGLCRLVELAER